LENAADYMQLMAGRKACSPGIIRFDHGSGPEVGICETVLFISSRSAKSQMLHLFYRVDNPGFSYKPEITAI
jgi:hypothetical protein